MGAHYFLGNALLDSARAAPMWSDSVVETASLALVCTHCGELWGRVASDQYPDSWTFQMRACGKHGGGSFIAAWMNEIGHFPKGVLDYELGLLLRREE